jgi:hypothetical protein
VEQNERVFKLGKNKELLALNALLRQKESNGSFIKNAKILPPAFWALICFSVLISVFLWHIKFEDFFLLSGILAGSAFYAFFQTYKAAKGWIILQKYFDWDAIESKMKSYRNSVS